MRRAPSAVNALCLVALFLAVAPLQAQQGSGVRVSPSLLKSYEGEYVYPDGRSSFRVTADANTLFQETAGRRAAYMPLSDSLFMLGPVFTAQFIWEAGGMTQVLSDGVGIEYRLRRRGSPPAPPPDRQRAPAVQVSREVLQQYVGTYEFIRGQMGRTDLRIYVRLEGDRLIREGAGATVVLTPISDTKFWVGDTSFVVEFVVDDQGVAQVLGTGFQQMLARRTSRD